MKKLFIISAGLVLAVFGGLLWWKSYLVTPLLAESVSDLPAAVPAEQAPDSTHFIAKGVVGAGVNEPLLAHTQGHVRRIFFSGGDYTRRGQVLAKLDNHTFVTAPRAGFLGPVEVTIGQRITNATEVTTLSRHSYLVVPVQLPNAGQQSVHTGDSARVWAAAAPARAVTGIVGPMNPAMPGNAPVEILLTSRAPFRIGEQAYVRLHKSSVQLTVQ